MTAPWNASQDVAHQLTSLAQSLDNIAGRLHSMAGVDTPGDTPVPTGNGKFRSASLEQLCERAIRAYRDRRRRVQLFSDDSLFGEPAWDILLDLFIADTRRKRVSVTSVCIGAAVPTTTALRWLRVLEDKGLILREEDAEDARRTFMRLSPKAYDLVAEYFSHEEKSAFSGK